MLLGSTTTPEFGWKAVTDNPLGQVARNPWDRSRTPGGSSGGAAVAAALGMGALHRRHRRRRLDPDPGLVHRHRRPEADLRAGAGLAALAVRHRGAYRADDPHGRRRGADAERPERCRRVATGTLCRRTPRDYRIGLEAGVVGLRIAASATLGGLEVDPEVLALFEAALDLLADLGAAVERVDPPLGEVRELFARTWFPGGCPACRAAAGRGPCRPRSRACAPLAEAGAAYGRAELLDAQLERGELGVRLQAFLPTTTFWRRRRRPCRPFSLGRDQPAPEAERRWIDWAGLQLSRST